ncbi:hypothetical protein ACLB2K_072592 [Fragaria x ananassa]
MSALPRGIEHREALGRAAESDRVATSRQVGTRTGMSRMTVHLGTSLFPDKMRDEGLPPLPEPISEVQARTREMEETLRAIRDSVASLAERVSDAERRGHETLAGEALSCFYELQSNSIDFFRQLADRFINRFILQTDKQNTSQLFKVK